MKGNNLNEFIDDLYSTGGPEKEFLHKGNRYFLESANIDDRTIEMAIFQCFGKGEYIFRCKGKNFAECAKQFENAKIFDGKTIYEVENEIEVLFG